MEYRAAREEAMKNGKDEPFHFDKPRPGAKFAPRFLAIAERNPEGPDAIDALCFTPWTSHAPRLGAPLETWDRSIKILRDYQWDVRHYPTIYILDAQVVIRHKDVRGEELEKAVNSLLEEAKTKTARAACRTLGCPRLAAKSKPCSPLLQREFDSSCRCYVSQDRTSAKIVSPREGVRRYQFATSLPSASSSRHISCASPADKA
jgi:hypothetical protein